MISIKKKRGSIRMILDDGQQIIIRSLGEISDTINMIESSEQLDFQQARGIIDMLATLRREIISSREKRCISDSSSIHSSRQRGRSF